MNDELQSKNGYGPLNVDIVSAVCTVEGFTAEVAVVLTIQRTANEEIEDVNVYIAGTSVEPTERGNSPQQSGSIFLHTYDATEFVSCDGDYLVEADVTYIERHAPATATPVSVHCAPCEGTP